MEASQVGATIRVEDGDARQQLFHARGIGQPSDDGAVELSWVEAAYLLERGDLESVAGLDATGFIATATDPHALARLCVYRDLRERGYYLSTAFAPGEAVDTMDVVFDVKPRGATPTSTSVAHRVVVLPESVMFSVGALPAGTIAIVDDEAEVTYVTATSVEPEGDVSTPSVAVSGRLAGGRVLVEEPPDAMYHLGLFGHPVDEPEGDLWLNLLEARYLVETGQLDMMNDTDIAHLGGEVEGEAFDSRYLVYRTLRDAGMVPRSGLKFGTDFRVYDALESADNPGHSSLLVETIHGSARLTPRVLSRAVRLANGVRKRHVYAIVDSSQIRWISVDRLRP